MNSSAFRFIFRLFAIAIMAMIVQNSVSAQEVLLDSMTKYGDLICYVSMDDPNRFYYLPDQPRLAYKDNKPQFTFLKYARTKATGEAGTGMAEGGGIVHFLVTYGASEERVRNAEKELQKRHPDAGIAGPIVYRKGNFVLITSFQEGNEVTTRAVAVGKAPLMEGQKAAVSIALTREGAELLWESFKSDTPDISIVFDMEFDGIREPYEATLEADWSQIEKNDRIKAGMKYKWFGAEVDMLFQELRQTGAIKITTKGEHGVMDSILQSANEKLLKVMFDPAAPAETPKTATDSSTSALNDAAKLLLEATKNITGSSGSTTGQKTSSLRNLYNRILKSEATLFLTSFFQKFVSVSYADTLKTDQDSHVTAEESINKIPDLKQKDSNDKEDLKAANEAYSNARRLYEEAKNGGFQTDATLMALMAYENYQRDFNPTGSRAEEVEGRIRMLRIRLESSADQGDKRSNVDSEQTPSVKDGKDSETWIPDLPPLPADPSEDNKKDTDSKEVKSTDKDKTETPASGVSTTQTPAPSTPSSSTTASGSPAADAKKTATSAQKKRSDGSPGFSLVASYQMKRIKRSGKMIYNMNNFRTETQAFAMAENIGSIFKRYGNDPGIFRAVTIDDPVFKQREIIATLDGQDASTFTKYLNFVTIKMRKRHQAGDSTTGEIVITPERFVNSNNNFSMIYGWKNDTDRDAWLNYEYQTIWSFHGGVEIRSPWIKTDSPMLAVSPPHRYRTISIEGDGESLTKEEVRHAVVTMNCRIGENYVSRQATIRNNGAAPSLIIDVPEDPENPETGVEITWHLTKNRKVSSGKFTLEGDIIYWDELPEGGI